MGTASQSSFSLGMKGSINEPRVIKQKVRRNGGGSKRAAALTKHQSRCLVCLALPVSIPCARGLQQLGLFPSIEERQLVHGSGAGNIEQTPVIACSIGLAVRVGHDHLVKFQAL